MKTSHCLGILKLLIWFDLCRGLERELRQMSYLDPVLQTEGLSEAQSLGPAHP